MSFHYYAACGSFLGMGRSRNEDNFYFNKKRLPVSNKGLNHPLKLSGSTEKPELFAVFDGLGGERQGEQAAYLASDVFGKEFKKLEELAISGRELLYAACENANNATNELTRQKQLNSMGTTVAALYIDRDEVVACNVGDSKIYRIRDNRMIQISEDHTDEKIMAAIGIKKKPVLLQYIGVPNTEMSIEPYISRGEIQSKDAYVICSDGVTDVLDVTQMYQLICDNAPDDAVRQILAEVCKKDGADNATVIVVKLL